MEFVSQLAKALIQVHETEPKSDVPNYRRYYCPQEVELPKWSSRSEIWKKAIEIADSPAPKAKGLLIHRDYHPGNTLWAKDQLTGIVDWTTGSLGAAEVDTGHMRWNLVTLHGVDTADRFLDEYESVSGPLEHQPYWDLVTVVDALPDLKPGSGLDLKNLEKYVEGVVRRA